MIANVGVRNEKQHKFIFEFPSLEIFGVWRVRGLALSVEMLSFQMTVKAVSLPMKAPPARFLMAGAEDDSPAIVIPLSVAQGRAVLST